MRYLPFILLILSIQIASAQDSSDPLQQIEISAWNYYCQNTLDGEGNATFCDCVLAKQNEANDPRIVRGSLLQLVNVNENATDADNNIAKKALIEMYSGNKQGASDDMQDFDDTLDDNVNACTVKPKS